MRTEIKLLERDIDKIDSFSDVCPTCGQKLVGVEKPNADGLKEHLKELKETYEKNAKEISDLTDKVVKITNTVETTYSNKLLENGVNIETVNNELDELLPKSESINNSK